LAKKKVSGETQRQQLDGSPQNCNELQEVPAAQGVLWIPLTAWDGEI